MAEENKQEQQVVEEIVEEEYVEDPHKWTFLKYIKSIARFKWWVIGFSLFGAVAGYLGFKFILNPMTKKLSASYTYNLAGEYIDDDTIRFIDGSLFNPYELSSRENLQKVKDSKEKYATINIDKLVNDNVVVISKTATPLNEKDTTSNIQISYAISAKAKYFPSDELGKEYLYDVINLSKELSADAISRYNAASFFTDNFSTITFDREIDQLSNQYDGNDNLYLGLINHFGNSVTANNDGAKLYELHNAYLANYYTNSAQTFLFELSSILKNEKYVNYVPGQETSAIQLIRNNCANYIQEIENDNRKIAVYQDSLDKLVATTTEYRDDIAKEIASLSKIITEIKLEIDELEDKLEDNGYFLDKDPASPTYNQYVFDESNQDTTIYKLSHSTDEWVSGCNEFKEKINSYKNKLEEDRSKVTTVYQYCYSCYQNKVNIHNGGYIALNGAISDILGAGAGLLVAFIVASLITTAVYIYKADKKE